MKKFIGRSTSRYNPALSLNIHKKNPILVVTATDKNLEQNKKTYLLLLNGKTGQLIDKILFFGEVHFSMPLIVDNLIFVPTRNHGIQMFSIQSDS